MRVFIVATASATGTRKARGTTVRANVPRLIRDLCDEVGLTPKHREAAVVEAARRAASLDTIKVDGTQISPLWDGPQVFVIDVETA
mgnify:CR=1 FL=1|jgi:hypothetical protein